MPDAIFKISFLAEAAAPTALLAMPFDEEEEDEPWVTAAETAAETEIAAETAVAAGAATAADIFAINPPSLLCAPLPDAVQMLAAT